MSEKKEKLPAGLASVLKAVEKNKYVALILLVGVAILLWPSGSEREAREGPPEQEVQNPLAFSLEEKEERIAQALSRIYGAGEVIVVLSLKTSLEQEVAVGEDSS